MAPTGKSKESSQFDPNRPAHDFKQKKNPRRQKQGSVGGRSMSYVPTTSERGFHHNWPKR